MRPARSPHLVFVALAATLLALAGCGKPCESHNGSADGYCDGDVANNCISTCADCIDEWKQTTCTGGCTVTDTFPPSDKVGGDEPHMSDATSYATCGEWTGDSGA